MTITAARRWILIVGLGFALGSLGWAQGITSKGTLPGAGPFGEVERPGNILLVIVDDMGNDKVSAYGEHPAAPPTPNIDALAARGVLFRNAYANPVCSPTRATIMTGRYSFRTGVGDVIIVKKPVAALPYAEVTLPELFDLAAPGTWKHALVGKWHLGSASFGYGINGLQQGWQHYYGVPGNLSDYFSWTKFEDGVSSTETEYITTVQIDDALRFTQQLQEPWMITLSTTAAHTPFHVPPANLHTQTLSGDPKLSKVEHFDAVVEALDTELGRLFASIDPAVFARTTVILIGDNGTPGGAVTAPFDPTKAKGFLNETGVNVPLIVAGYGVPARGAECQALVGSVDLFATLAELAGINPRAVLGENLPLDSVSLVPYFSQPGRSPLREYAYVEKFSPNGVAQPTIAGRAIRDERWKLIQRQGASDQLYDLGSLIVEGEDLLKGSGHLTPTQQEGYNGLLARLKSLGGGG